jgi:hypothetical protein
MPSLQSLVTSLLLAGSAFGAQVAAKADSHHGDKIVPKVFIVSMVDAPCEMRGQWPIEELY